MKILTLSKLSASLLFSTVLTFTTIMGQTHSFSVINSSNDTLLYVSENGNIVIDSNVIINGYLGIGVKNPGQKLHIGDGNILVEGGGETALKIKRDVTYSGGPSGVSQNPIFELGRIIQAGDKDPEFRFLYSDDLTPERSVLEFDRKGIMASIKQERGSHFEGFISSTDPEPIFRLNSYPKMRLEMGEGGATPVDVAIQRESANTLTFITNNTEQLRINPDGNVGIGTKNPANILTIAQNSATDPIADSWTTYSSRRWKTNINTIEDAIYKVQNLRGVTYDWKADGKHDIGLIAEEVGKVIPEVVVFENNGKDAKSIDYGRLVAVLIEAVKEQQKTIAEQNSKIAEISTALNNLESSLMVNSNIQLHNEVFK